MDLPSIVFGFLLVAAAGALVLALLRRGHDDADGES